MTCTKSYIIEKINKEVGISLKDSGVIFDTLTEIIKRTLQNEEDLLFSGFGKFVVHSKNERKGRNPVTKEPMIIKKRKVVLFRRSRKLKDKIVKGSFSE